jgi:thioredoxin reductase (NADPH)
MEKEKYDVIVIGAGPGGLTAALYASRAGLSTLILDRGAPGGQMLATERIDNYPGFLSVKGGELTDKMVEHAKHWGAELAYADVKGFTEREDDYFTVQTASGDAKGRALIISTGAKPRQLGCKGEAEFTGRGVSYCAICDGNFYKNLIVCVVGGGDSAVEEAVHLSHIAKTVHILHRRDEFRAKKVASDAARSRPNIILEWNTIADEVIGEQFVTGLRARDVNTNETRLIPCDGVFFYVGINPITEFTGGKLELTGKGFIKTHGFSTETSMPGVFAVGDVRRDFARQVACAVGDGAQAAIEVQQYLLEYPW